MNKSKITFRQERPHFVKNKYLAVEVDSHALSPAFAVHPQRRRLRRPRSHPLEDPFVVPLRSVPLKGPFKRLP